MNLFKKFGCFLEIELSFMCNKRILVLIGVMLMSFLLYGCNSHARGGRVYGVPSFNVVELRSSSVPNKSVRLDEYFAVGAVGGEKIAFSDNPEKETLLVYTGQYELLLVYLGYNGGMFTRNSVGACAFVTVTLEPDKEYVVKGQRDGNKVSLWVADKVTDQPVSRKSDSNIVRRSTLDPMAGVLPALR